ncbi:MAG: M1 family metallopeptidase [Candidatus Thorarchaeota archaeon]|nr:M1 family metallopeptidase [Candidatus Thorarchaeota archaeon]
MKGYRFAILIMLVLGFSMLSQTSPFQMNDFSENEIIATPLQDADLILSENFEEMNLSSLDLSLYLNETDATVPGNLTIDFYNSDPVVFSSIPFHLYLSGMLAGDRLGYIEILNVSALTPSPVPLTFDVYSVDQLMWIHLIDDLQPNTSIILEIVFESVLPTDSSDRAGVSGTDIDSSKMYEFASAYPIPCVYDEYDGWNTDPYLDTGDPFYLDMAYYDFNLTLPNAMKVAATGELMGVDVGTTSTIYRYTPSAPVREITFCASRYYIIESQIYHGVNVSSYYLPESVSLWSSNGLAWGIRALSLFNNTFGPYPFTTLNIVEDSGFYYGMEYPCQVYLSNIINDRYQNEEITADVLDSVIAHEVAHQWWYHLVGNDEVDVGFLDEGLAVWSVYYYSEFYNLGWTGKEFDFISVRMIYPAKINQSIYDESSTYYFTAYDKTPVVLEKLRQIIGTADYLDSLRLFFTRFSFRLAFLPDLQTAFEDQLNRDLDWFFVPMFDNAYLPEYSFQSVFYNSSSNSLVLVIEDLNEGFHIRRYTQNFTVEVETTDETIEFTDVQLYGTTEVILSLPESSTGTPTTVILLYDDYSLVQLDDPLVHFISTSNITNDTPINSTTPSTPEPPWDPGLTIYILAGAGIGVIALAIVALVQKKNRS